MLTIDITIHDIIVEPDGITFVGQSGEKYKIVMNEQELELLRERLQEKV